MGTGIEERPFFSLGASYNVASDAKAEDLLDDASCLISCLKELVGTLATGLSEKDGDMAANPRSVSSILFGAQYSLQMIGGAVDAANSRIMHARTKGA